MSELIEEFDHLIASVEEAVVEVEECQFYTERGKAPRRGTFQVAVNAFNRQVEPHDIVCEVYRVMSGEFMLHSPENPGRGSNIAVRILVTRDHRGEILHAVEGKVTFTKRISGSYEVKGEVNDLKRVAVPVRQRFMECVAAGNAAAWNRWCADLVEGPLLEAIHLAKADLTNYDLCCARLVGCNFEDANLAGANLSGADLTDCNLTGANLTGADIFRAKIPRRHLGILADSGLVEVESVVLVG